MSAPSVIQGNVHIAGNLSASGVTLPSKVVSNNNIAEQAGIDATKVIQQHRVELQRAVPAVEEATVHLANAQGAIVQFSASCRTAPASGKSYKVDLEVNGTSVLTAPLEFTNSTTPLARQIATLDEAAYAAEDIFSVVITSSTGGTLGTDLLCDLILRELPMEP
jgi:hypothetical protein